MKFLFISLFVVFNFFISGSGSSVYGQKLENGKSNVNSKSNTKSCREKKYRIKSEAVITAMNSLQLFNELLKINNNSFDELFQIYAYEDFIEKRIRQAGIDSLLVFTEYANAYDPSNASECDSERFYKILRLAADMDRFEFRLRGTTEGRLTIDAIERAIERKEKTGIEVRKEDRTLFLNNLKGVNEVDRAFQDAFWMDKKIEISADELSEFSNFLVERDLTYPVWSERTFVKDYSRINKAGNPLQVYIFNNPERFYEAYSEYKKQKGDKKL